MSSSTKMLGVQFGVKCGDKVYMRIERLLCFSLCIYRVAQKK